MHAAWANAGLAWAVALTSCGSDPSGVAPPSHPATPPDAAAGGFEPPWGGQQTKIPTDGIASGAGGGAAASASTGEMTFFVTSAGNGSKGGDLGGVAGADALCQKLAEQAGASDKTWTAYLSTQREAARDRIGRGPWHNAKGEVVAPSVAALHDAGISKERAIDETGKTIDMANAHDILTGSKSDGTFAGASCRDYTSSSPADTVWVGHADGGGVGQERPESWNAAHESNGCDAASLQKTASRAHLYCFAR